MHHAAPIVFPTRLVFPTSLWVETNGNPYRGTNHVPDTIGVPHIPVGRTPLASD